MLSQLKQFIIGALVGIASMLPGVSGAVLAVCFGVYERLIEDVAHIKKALKEDLPFLIIIVMGVLFGMIVSAFGLDYIMNLNLVVSYFLFMGLIIGQIPQLYGLTEPHNGNISIFNAVAFIIGILIMMFFLVIGNGDDVEINRNITSYVLLFLAGIIIAISKIAPGISGSTLLLALGLFGPLTTAMTDMDFTLLIPVGLGLIAGILGFAKIVDKALKEHRRSTYCMILGLTIGSLAVILGYSLKGSPETIDFVYGLIAAAIGVLISVIFAKIGKTTNSGE